MFAVTEFWRRNFKKHSDTSHPKQSPQHPNPHQTNPHKRPKSWPQTCALTVSAPPSHSPQPRQAGLRTCLNETQAAKDQHRPPLDEIPTGHLGRLGPGDPHVNPTAFRDYEQISRELYHWCLTWRDIACPTAVPVNKQWSGQQYCNWIIENSAIIAATPDAELFTQDLERYASMLLRYLPPATEVPEHRQTAKSICHRMRTLGYDITPELLRKWAERNKVTIAKRPNGENLHLLAEVLATKGTMYEPQRKTPFHQGNG